MKKTMVIILALVFVLGLAGTAFAAGPFADVPAKHWAYDAVSSLAKAGIIDGYGDGTFRGDRTMTRYEMAQLVGRAIEKEDKADAQQKAMIHKLATEFAAELNNLGVRVTAIENQVGKVKISGEARIRWVQNFKNNAPNDSTFNERFQINMNAKVNDSTSFYGRLQMLNYYELGTTDTAPAQGAPTGTVDTPKVTDAALTTQNLFNTGIAATYGRFSQKILATGYWADTTGMIDGIKLDAGNKLKVTASFANWNPAITYYKGGAGIASMGDTLYLGANYASSKATTFYGAYLKSKDGDGQVDVKGVGITSYLTKNLMFSGDYAKNDAFAGQPAGYIAGLTYRSYNPAVPGTWNIVANYRKFETGWNYSGISTAWLSTLENSDIKAYMLNFNYVPAKNMYINTIYSFNGKTADGSADKPNYFRIQVTSLF
ncbi:hypothetical protein SCACP_28380 [Sporomusa carbonis]|uniref:S-layer homology domain-containing protein n=1 Tax=Sporomusa carbonis TaxID=3076075 RepID=UPI003A79AA47